MNHSMQVFVIAVIPLLFSITVHEAAHGFVASKLGDNTALLMGRVTLNPLKHIDPIGTVLLPMLMLYLSGFIFGWAKPVPLNWQNLHNPKRDAAFVAIAGPLSNFIMALMWALIGKLIFMTNGQLLSVGASVNALSSGFDIQNMTTFFYAMAKFGIVINCALMVLNLLPIPPLDGSRVVSSLLPSKLSGYYNSIEPYGIWILLGLFLIGGLQWMLLPLMQFMIGLISGWLGLI